MTDEEIGLWIDQLLTLDYGKQLIALGRLVEAGDAAVPRLFVTLAKHPLRGRIQVMCALAGIGTQQVEVIKAGIRFWELNQGNSPTNEAMLHWVKKIADPLDPASIAALTCFLGCWRKSVVNTSNTPALPIGHTLSIIAAQALASLSYNHPTPELLEVLPYMKGSSFLNGMPHQIETARKTIERNTAHMKDLPRIAEAPKTIENLPRISQRDQEGE